MDLFGNSYKVFWIFARVYFYAYVLEPTSLEKVAKQEEEEKAETVEKTATTEIVIGENGTEQIVRTMRPRSSTPSERSYRYDIMISYCHSDKELTYKIHRFLIDQGFKVWLDLDNMYGPGRTILNYFFTIIFNLYRSNECNG